MCLLFTKCCTSTTIQDNTGLSSLYRTLCFILNSRKKWLLLNDKSWLWWLLGGRARKMWIFWDLLLCKKKVPTFFNVTYPVHRNKNTQKIFCFQSLSAGIFIYITFMSLIPEEFNSEQNMENSGWKVLGFSCGWSIMTLLSFVVTEWDSFLKMWNIQDDIQGYSMLPRIELGKGYLSSCKSELLC